MKPPTLPVLLIEDEPAVMAYVRAVLERSGYAVVSTESGAAALRILESEQFLGVVSDMRTPGGVDGADVHAWLSRHRPDLAARQQLLHLLQKLEARHVGHNHVGENHVRGLFLEQGQRGLAAVGFHAGKAQRLAYGHAQPADALLVVHNQQADS